MADGKVVIETGLDSSGIEKGISKLGSLTTKGLKTAATTITGTAVALEGIGIAAVKAGSDFEAQMSRVKSISGATGAEFEKLKDQAIQLGADTSFSASQAAEGMENLAAAGFTTNEIMEAMPGLLDMAAASGEDLSSSSEIAASTLRGFGLEAEEAGHVADVLAENANRTNAAVSDTGEAMKYVTPLARAAGIRFEETAAAIGIMANAGIKGSQAGTTLRAAISRLSKPTDDMRDAMEELGISFYDSNGKMKSLSEQVGMLEGAFSGMTDEQKNNYLVTLYGQEALSGMLALINEGQGSLTDLTKSYENCDGSAKKAADTMQDNLKGAIDELSGSAESLGIVFYEDVSDSLKETAKTATESINNITEAFEDGGLEEAIEVAGDEFANLAVKAAEHAPDMVDTAVDFIESFVKGLGKNKKKLIGAAGDVAKTLAGGLADLLPDELERPVDEAIDAISDSLNSGGLKKAGKTLVTTFDNLVDAAGNLAEKALPPLTKGLDFAAENLDVLAASAAAAFTAFKGYKVVKETSSVLSKGTKAWKAASDAVDVFNAAQLIAMESGIKSNVTLTAGQTVIGLLTGKITLATAAQTAWNAVMNANPIGLVITAVGALAAGVAAYKLVTDEGKTSQEKLNESLENAGDDFETVGKAAADFTEGIKNAGSIFDDFNDSIIVSNEIQQECASQMDAVQSEITQIARTATEERRGLTETEIQRLDELFSKMRELTAQELAIQKAYATAVRDSAKSLADTYDGNAQEYAEASQVIINSAYETKDSVVSKAYEQMLETNAINQQLVGTAEQYTQEWYENEAAAAQERYQQAVESATKECGDTLSIIQQGYADRATAGMEYLTKIGEVNSQAEQEKKRHEDRLRELEEEHAKHADETRTLREAADATYRANVAKENKEHEATLAAIWDNITANMSSEQMEQAGVWLAMITQTAMSGGELSAEAKNTAGNFIEALSQMPEETREKFKNTVEGAFQGLDGFDEIQQKAESTGKSFLEVLAEVLQVHSPSRAVKKIFSYVWPGAVEGLKEGEDEVSRKGKSVISDFFTELGGDKVVQKAKKIGNNVLNFFGIGIKSQKGNIDKTSKEIAESSNELLGSKDTKKTGKQKSDEYNKGVASNKNPIDKTSRSIADSSNRLLGSADTKGTGSRKSKEYDLGVGSNKSSIDLTSKTLATSSDTLLGSMNTRATGANKSSEYNSGLGSNRGAIDSTSRGLSNTANSGMGSADTKGTGKRKSNEYNVGLNTANTRVTGVKKAQEANSGLGSVSASGTGKNFVQGFINGFGLADVWNAAWNIGKRALASLSASIKEGSPSRLTKLSGKYFGRGFGLGIKGEGKNVEKESENLANIALDSLDMSAITERMHEVMAMNTNRVARQIMNQNIHVQHMISDERDRLSDREIQAIGKAIANVVNDHMEDLKIIYHGRELGRVIREVGR